MKTNPSIFLLFILIVITGVGCEDLKKLSTPPKQEKKEVKKIEVVENPQLAQLILKPKHQKLDISKDPFEPLFVDKKKDSSENLVGVDVLEDVKFLGLVRVGDTTSALLKTKTSKGMYHVDDSIRDYKVVNITEAEVVLTNGKRTVKVKRGAKK